MDSSQYISLSEATKRCPNRPSTNAVWRWCRKGVKSRTGETIRLAHVRVGGKIYTTAPQLDAFFKAIADSDTEYFVKQQNPTKPAFSRTRTDKQRARDYDRAEAELKASGF